MGYLKNELTGFVPVEQATEIIKMVTRGFKCFKNGESRGNETREKEV